MFLLPHDLTVLFDTLRTKTTQAYLVGGCVRDMILGEEPHDYDICTDLKPEETMQLLRTKYTVIPKGMEFGTVVAIIHGAEYEITTFRGEGTYSDGRHPDSVNFANTIEEDLCRRDFTINAMAYHPFTDTIVDPFDGVTDLRDGMIRAVGDANRRFQEDGLRILRAMRFAVRFGFDIDSATSLAMLQNKKMLDLVSKERITDEFRKMFGYNMPVRNTFLNFHEIVTQVIPELKPCVAMPHDNPYHKHDIYEHCLAVTDLCDTTSFEIKMAALLHDIGKPATRFFNEEKGYYSYHGHPEVSANITESVLANDFRCTVHEREMIHTLVKYHDTEIVATAPCVKRWLNRIGAEAFQNWTILKTADRDDHVYPNGKENVRWYPDTEGIRALIDQVLETQATIDVKDLAISGKDLIALGMKPGPEFSYYLNECLEAVLDEEIPNEKDALIAYVEDLQQEISNLDMDPGNK